MQWPIETDTLRAQLQQQRTLRSLHVLVVLKTLRTPVLLQADRSVLGRLPVCSLTAIVVPQLGIPHLRLLERLRIDRLLTAVSHTPDCKELLLVPALLVKQSLSSPLSQSSCLVVKDIRCDGVVLLPGLGRLSSLRHIRVLLQKAKGQGPRGLSPLVEVDFDVRDV